MDKAEAAASALLCNTEDKRKETLLFGSRIIQVRG